MKKVIEASPDTFEGATSDDMLLSRIWITKKLKETNQSISEGIVLGSWYGILPFALNKFMNIKKLYAVDKNPDYIKTSKIINPDVKHIVGDCNKLSYRKPITVINPSINDMPNLGWFDKIPKKSLCVFHIGDGVQRGCPRNLQEMKEMYPLNKILYEGSLDSIDKQGKLKRYMMIGIK